MRRRRPAVSPWPPHLADFAAEDWVDEYHWRMARWDWYKAHPKLRGQVNPIELLRERREARLAAP